MSTNEEFNKILKKIIKKHTNKPKFNITNTVRNVKTPINIDLGAKNVRLLKTVKVIFPNPKSKHFTEIIKNTLLGEEDILHNSNDYTYFSNIILQSGLCLDLDYRYVIDSVYRADFIVAILDEQNDEIVAYATILIKNISAGNKYLYIDLICSNPTYKRSGTMLIQYIHSLATENGMNTVSLNSVPQSIGFYEKQGYTTNNIDTIPGLISMTWKKPQKAGRARKNRFKKTLKNYK
jgi:hypothetical protein